MRDLQAVWEADPQGQAWAAQMRQTLTKARRAVDDAVDAGASNLPPATLGQLRGLYANTAEQGVAANAPGVKGASKEAYKLAKRMAKRIDQVLYFSVDFDVDWTNNSCEQAIRMPSSRPRSAGAGGACAGSRPSAASVPTSPPPGRTTSPSSPRCATPSSTAPGASQQPHDRIGQPTRSRTPLNGYARSRPCSLPGSSHVCPYPRDVGRPTGTTSLCPYLPYRRSLVAAAFLVKGHAVEAADATVAEGISTDRREPVLATEV